MLRKITINGDIWGVARVPAGDPRLIDRTGTERLAVTDPLSMTIYILDVLTPPMLDKVMVHEVSHAITISHGLLAELRKSIPPASWVDAEEWAARLVEDHGLEAYRAASEALGRPACVGGFCDKS